MAESEIILAVGFSVDRAVALLGHHIILLFKRQPCRGERFTFGGAGGYATADRFGLGEAGACIRPLPS